MQRLLLITLLALAILLLGRGARGEDPLTHLLSAEKLARPSGTYAYDDVPFDRDPQVEQPCLSARFCECTAQGGWNRTFWLNTASAMFQGQLYVVILQRITMYRPKITYHQKHVKRHNQVMEANTLLFCKADLLSQKVYTYDCKAVNPQQEYRERHPFPTHQHFNLVGLIDPRLASAGDEDGLYLQAGCRPKVLGDLHEITKFRETPCLIKVLEGSGAASSRPVAQGSSTATSHLRHLTALSGHAHSSSAAGPAQQLQSHGLPQQPWHALQRRLQNAGAPASGGDARQERVPVADATTAASAGNLAQQGQAADTSTVLAAPAGGSTTAEAQAQAAPASAADSKLQTQPATHTAGEKQQAHQAQEQQLGSRVDEAGQDWMASHILAQGMREVTKDWDVMHLNPIAYTSGKQFPCEKNWVPFEFKGRLLWNRYLSPQEIITVHANGTATTLYRNKNAGVFKPLAAICGTGPRGNTPAIRIRKEETGLPKDYYLGILHWTPKRGMVGNDAMERWCHEYLNFFYLMDAEPPFHIIEVARPPIPLAAATQPIYEAWPLYFRMGYISFPTGLVVTQGKVIITYGVGDRKVRVWRASLRDVLLTFSVDVSGQLPDSQPGTTGQGPR